MKTKNSLSLLVAGLLLFNPSLLYPSELYLVADDFSSYSNVTEETFDSLEQNRDELGYDLTNKLIQIRYSYYSGVSEYEAWVNALKREMITRILNSSKQELPIDTFIQLISQSIPQAHKGLMEAVQRGQATLPNPSRPSSLPPVKNAPPRPFSPAPAMPYKASNWDKFKNFFTSKN